ncbi:hypothetical protein ACFSHT_04710 [Paraburkholderia silviterrae]|uniref:hypothetical protein n=1 Tax=Paraburkholderia silviterrae TaxID=2528715 RepID=UPI0014051621|nr:hypothetical protein [Paraburkholderia silviterrae]
MSRAAFSSESVRERMRLLDWFCRLRRRTTASNQAVERGTHQYKNAGVFYGVW